MQSTSAKFQLHEPTPGFLVLTCRGGLSWEDRELLSASVEQHLVGRKTVQGLVIDMSEVDFVNSAGLGALFQLAQRLRSRGGQLAFASIKPAVQRLFSAVGMDRLAKGMDDVPSALALLSGTIELID